MTNLAATNQVGFLVSTRTQQLERERGSWNTTAGQALSHLLFSSVRGKVSLALELLGAALYHVSLGPSHRCQYGATRVYLADCVGILIFPISRI